MAVRFAALLLPALAAACGREAAPPPEPVPASRPTAAAAAPAPTCAFSPAVALDEASFVRDDLPAFAPERLDGFRAAAGAAFAAAAEAACTAGEVPAERLAGVRRLLVQSASGATETAFYEDAESQPAGTLVFQWVFAESDLALPDAADISAGLACWTQPDRPACAEREP